MQTTTLEYLEVESLTHQRPDPGVLRHGSADSTLNPTTSSTLDTLIFPAYAASTG